VGLPAERACLGKEQAKVCSPGRRPPARPQGARNGRGAIGMTSGSINGYSRIKAMGRQTGCCTGIKLARL